jgi:hypothetical protein
MKDSKMKKHQFHKILLSLFLLPLGFFQCWADDEFDPFDPEANDPGNVEVVRLLPFVLLVGVFYAFRKFSKKNLNVEQMIQKEDLK